MSQPLKRAISTLVVLLIAGLGLLGITVTLFPPDGTQTTPVSTLLGLIFSGLFLFVAWIIWRWSRSCLLCQAPTTSKHPSPHE